MSSMYPRCAFSSTHFPTLRVCLFYSELMTSILLPIFFTSAFLVGSFSRSFKGFRFSFPFRPSFYYPKLSLIGVSLTWAHMDRLVRRVFGFDSPGRSRFLRLASMISLSSFSQLSGSVLGISCRGPIDFVDSRIFGIVGPFARA